MATTAVTLKLAPFELQIIRDALQLYVADMTALDRVGEALRAPVPVYDSDPHICANKARLLMDEIGLRAVEDEHESGQLHMFRVNVPQGMPQREETDHSDATGTSNGSRMT